LVPVVRSFCTSNLVVLLPLEFKELKRASLILPQCVQLHGASLFMGLRRIGYISGFVCIKHDVCLLCVKGAQIPSVCTVSSDIFRMTIEFFLTNRTIYHFTCPKQKAPDKRFTGQSRVAGAYYRTCFISSL